MSAEFELLSANRGRLGRSIQRLAEPIFSAELTGLGLSNLQETIDADCLYRLIGKSSFGLIGDKYGGLHDFINDLDLHKLKNRVSKLVNIAMSQEQLEVITTVVAPEFSSVYGEGYEEAFTLGYGFYAGLHCSSPDTAQYRWPVIGFGFCIDDECDVEELARNLTTNVARSQPYIYEFVTGKAGRIFDMASGIYPNRSQEKLIRETALTGIGLAATQLQIEYSFQLDSEMVDLTF